VPARRTPAITPTLDPFIRREQGDTDMSNSTISRANDRIVRTAQDVAGLGTILGVWAHPDDEVYLSAGVMAAAAAAGNRVVVVTATRGERGTDDPARWPPARLAEVRVRELAASLAVLDGGRGRIEHRYLGEHTGRCYLDGELAHGRSGPAVAELAGIVDEVAPDTILTFGPDGMTGHPDHRAVSAWTDRAVRAATWHGARVLHAVVTAGYHRDFSGMLESIDGGGDAFPAVARRHLAVDVVLRSGALQRKLAALDAHATQVGPLQRMLGDDGYRLLVEGEWFRAAGLRS
jgi:LmbE family N-acetylglucosaminyl deacetylase